MGTLRAVKKILKAEVAAALVNVRGAHLQQSTLWLSPPDRNSTQTALEGLYLSVHSQYEEDGILLTLFRALGVRNRYCVELCAGDGMESNTANLIVNHGWTGLLCDGDPDNVKGAQRFYSRCRSTRIWPPTVVHRWLTAENVNAFLTDHSVPPEPDLLSIDVDGNDYWIWRAIDVILPRVVVIEINHLWGLERAVTIPYKPDFKTTFTTDGTDYAGASLPAMLKLADDKGYRLVAMNRIGTNAFFVRKGLGDDVLPALDPSRSFDHPRARYGRTVRLSRVRHMEWEDV